MNRKYKLLILILLLLAVIPLMQTKEKETIQEIQKNPIQPSIITRYEIPTQQLIKYNEIPIEEPTKKLQSTKEPQQAPKLDIPISKDLQNKIFKLCDKDNDFYCLVIAVMDQESDFKADSVSADGHDYGLFQIRDCNFSWLKDEIGVNDFTDPYENSKCAVHMLKNLIDKYEHYNLVLMAYNMGEYGAKSKWEQGIYGSSYTRAVMAKYEEYKKQAKER